MQIKWRSSDRLLLLITTLVFGGAIIFIILFFKAFTVHDYYLTNLLIIVTLVSILFLSYLKSNRISLFGSKAFKGMAVAGLVLMVYNTMVIQRAKYDYRDTFVKHNILINEEDRKFYKYVI
ncbi:MAG: hypothetical protein KAT15_12600, partial [Bacteroidales bacterium]|nr:hypothetical protein [Bacteroidales bacterium]